MSNRPYHIKDPEDLCEYRRTRVAACRARKAHHIEELQDSINAHRAILDLPPKDFTKKPAWTRKGTSRPNYEPPPEELANMTKEEIKEWKIAERKKRRNKKGREKKDREDAYKVSLRKELRDLEVMVYARYEKREEVRSYVRGRFLLERMWKSTKSHDSSERCGCLIAPSQAEKAIKIAVDKIKMTLKEVQVATTLVRDLSQPQVKSATVLDKKINKEVKKRGQTVKKEKKVAKKTIELTPINSAMELKKQGQAVTKVVTIAEKPIIEFEPLTDFDGSYVGFHPLQVKVDIEGIESIASPTHRTCKYENDDFSAISHVELNDHDNASLNELVKVVSPENFRREAVTQKEGYAGTNKNTLTSVSNINAWEPDSADHDIIANDGDVCLGFDDDDVFLEAVTFDKTMDDVVIDRDDDPMFEQPLFANI